MSINRQAIRAKRAFRVRKKISGTAACPRLTVSRSNKNISAQIIDDVTGTTLCSCSSLSSSVNTDGVKKSDVSALVGSEIAKKALALGIEKIVFDRNGYLYRGQRISKLAEAAREAGLKF